MLKTADPVLVRVSRLRHQYPSADTPVLEDVSVDFVGGELTVIYGPSGSGKSTLLSILGLLMRPNGGTISILGEQAWQSRSQTDALRRSAYAWILQNSACLEARSALDNVAMSLLALGAHRDEALHEAAQALTRVGLGHRLTARASELSGGELQRVTIARAISSRQPIVLADEPTGQLDRVNSELVASALQACTQTGQVVIVATHDSSFRACCDRHLEMADGQVHQLA